MYVDTLSILNFHRKLPRVHDIGIEVYNDFKMKDTPVSMYMYVLYTYIDLPMKLYV